jgi:hypothetical protein
MMSREFFYWEGRTWFVRLRPAVRKDETATHVTLELVTDNETRVVSCRRDEWDVAEPDYAGLLARSVAAGASRGIAHPSGNSEPDSG